MKTNLDNIYALGDVTGIMQLSSVAYKTADIIARNILNTKYQELLNTNLVLWSIYLNPEIAGVGKNANQLKEENIEFNEIFYQVNHYQEHTLKVLQMIYILLNS